MSRIPLFGFNSISRKIGPGYLGMLDSDLKARNSTIFEGFPNEFRMHDVSRPIICSKVSRHSSSYYNSSELYVNETD